MPAKAARFHEDASEEYDAAFDWYLAHSEDAARRFDAEVNRAIALIVETPQRWPAYLYGSRRFVLQRFPFSVVYLDEPESPRVVAVAHGKRKPGYWKGRM